MGGRENLSAAEENEGDDDEKEGFTGIGNTLVEAFTGEVEEGLTSDIAEDFLADSGESEGVKQEGHPFSTLGPHSSPNAVNCTTQVQSSTVVVARIIHSFIFDLDTMLLAPFPLSKLFR